MRRSNLITALLLIAAALAAGCATPTRILYDAEVDRLCGKDGGIRVFEQVKLTPEQYAKYSKGIRLERATPPDDLFYANSTSDYLKGPKGGAPEEAIIMRFSSEIVRRADKKVLVAQTSYFRRGGDISFGTHPSSYSCPSGERLAALNKQGALEAALFIKGDSHVSE